MPSSSFYLHYIYVKLQIYPRAQDIATTAKGPEIDYSGSAHFLH